MIDDMGNTLWTSDHLPFGETVDESGGAFDPLLRYPGQWAVPEAEKRGLTKVFYNGYRWYSPGWGRYTQADPIGLMIVAMSGRYPSPSPGRGGKEYSYAAGNPLLFLDPLGLKECCPPTSDCPGGEWDYSGTGVLFTAIWGISGGKGTFTCSDRSSISIDIRYDCWILGPIINFGWGWEKDVELFRPKGCNKEDLLGDFSGGVGSVFNVGITYLSDGARRRDSSSSISGSADIGVGAGGGYISCTVLKR